MATIQAQADGNWSATATWTGAVVPGDADTADLNGHAVTIDVPQIHAHIIEDTVGTGSLTLNSGNATIGTAANNTEILGTFDGSQGVLIINGGNCTLNGTVVNNCATDANGQSFTVLIAGGTLTINGPASGGGSYAVTNVQPSTTALVQTTASPTPSCAILNAPFSQSSVNPTMTVNGDVLNSGANSVAILAADLSVTRINGNTINGDAVTHTIAANGSAVLMDCGQSSGKTLLQITGNATNYANGGFPVKMGTNKSDDGILDVFGNWQNYDHASSGGNANGCLANIPGSVIIVRGNVDALSGNVSITGGRFFDTSAFGNCGLLIVLGKILQQNNIELVTLIAPGSAATSAPNDNNACWVYTGPIGFKPSGFQLNLAGGFTLQFVVASKLINYMAIGGGAGPFPGGGSCGPYPIEPGSLGPFPIP